MLHTWLSSHPLGGGSVDTGGKGKQKMDEDASMETRSQRINFARATAVAFLQLEKSARVVSVTKGSGFLVANLGWRGGHPVWSAPCFLQQSSTGFGVSWGSETVTSCYLINTPEAMEKFTEGKLVLGAESYRTRSNAVLEEGLNYAGKNVDEVVIYGVSAGKMMDVGLNAGYLTPSQLNAKIYGEARKPAGILSGKVPAPVEFEPIYEVLDNLAIQGAKELHKLQQAGVHIAPVYHAVEAGSSQGC